MRGQGIREGLRSPHLSITWPLDGTVDQSDADANPLDPRFGFLPRCTSRHETETAGRLGYAASQLVLSGPAKFWPGGFQPGRVHTFFCDSLLELRSITDQIRRGSLIAEYLGATLRLAGTESRFGIPVSAPAGLAGLCSLLADLPASQKIGLEFRADGSQIGIERWSQSGRQFLKLAREIGSRIGRPIACLGLGGNWYSEDWLFALKGAIAQWSGRAADEMFGVLDVLVDSGEAFSQPARCVITRVLEVRKEFVQEVVVDASIRELPRAAHFPHRVVWRSSNDLTWRSIRPGRATILGRLHLEADILARRVEIPDDLRAGDLLAFRDVTD